MARVLGLFDDTRPQTDNLTIFEKIDSLLSIFKPIHQCTKVLLKINAQTVQWHSSLRHGLNIAHLEISRDIILYTMMKVYIWYFMSSFISNFWIK